MSNKNKPDFRTTDVLVCAKVYPSITELLAQY